MLSADKNQEGFSGNKLFFIIKAGAGFLALFLGSIAVSRIIYPFDIGHQEAFSWMPATHLLEGKNPYSFAFTPPYSMVPYGIVYYALLAVGVGLFGFQLWWGRLLSVLAFAVCVCAVVKITKKLTGSTNAAWAAGLISLALFPAQAWIATMRSDFVALAFAFTALCLVLTRKEEEPTSAGRLPAVILLCAAAFFTKHTFLLPVGIIFLRMGQCGRWRDAALLVGGFVIFAAGGMLFLNYTSGGGYVWQHFMHAQALPFSSEKLVEGAGLMARMPTSLVFAAAMAAYAYLSHGILKRTGRAGLMNLLKSPQTLILFYLFLSLAAATASSGRVGANINYYLESAFLMAIAGGLIYADFRGKAPSTLAAALVVLMIGGGAFQMARAARGEYYRWEARRYYREIEETAAQHAPAGSVCFSIYVELVARGGCAFHFDDYGEYTTDWTPALAAIFEREVRAGRYAVVVWDRADFEEKFPNYRLIKMTQKEPERFFPVYLYVRATGTPQ